MNDPDVSRPTKNLFRREEEPQYYESLDSLAGDEEIVLVERPDPAAELAKAADDLAETRAAQQTIDDDNERSPKAGIPRSNSKRGHEALADSAESAEAPSDNAGSTNGKLRIRLRAMDRR